MSGDRLHCCTPGCRRTRKPFGGFSEWVCQKCYDRVPTSTRREHTDAKKDLRIKARRTDKTHEEILEAWNRSQAAWGAVKQAARGGLPDDNVLKEIGVF